MEVKFIRKQLVIIGIVAILVTVGLSGCTEQKKPINNNTSNNNQTTPNNNNPPNNEPTTYTVTIKLVNTTSSSFLQVFYQLYENIQNWKDTNPINGTSSIVFERGLPNVSSFNVSADKTYIIEIWNSCGCSNCDPCYVPETMLDKHFIGTFSSNETFTIQSTGYITKSDGSLLTQS